MREDTSIKDGYLKDFLRVEHFDCLIHAAHKLAVIEESDSMAKFRKPSVGQKIGRLLKACCLVLEGQASRRNDDAGEKNATRTERLIANEWSYKVNAISHKTTEENRRNKPVFLPSTEDLLKLKDYLETEVEAAKNRLKEEKTTANFQTLQSLVLCRLIMFNRRRSGEVSDVRLDDYLSRPNWHSAVNSEIYSSPPKIEQMLVER